MSRRTFEDSVVNGDLSYWGFWKGLQYAAEGYSPENTLAQIFSGRAENPGHRVLCLDMKPRAWQINGRIYRHLPMWQIAALTARFCLPARDSQPYRAKSLLVSQRGPANLSRSCAGQGVLPL